MRYFLCAAALMLMFAPATAFAQSAPNLVTGQVPTAVQWNSYFAAKQDYNPNLGCAFSPCVPPIATTPNSILETNTSGTPSFSTLLPSGMTYPNPQFSGTTAGGILSGNFSLSTSGQAQITNTTPSTSPTTGAATIAGGLGVGGALNVGGNLTVGGNLNVGGTISGTISPPTENPNTVYAGPSSGSPAAASFRALAQADLPNVTPSGGNTASPVPTLLGRVVTPIDFGAAGNGTTNDTTAVQNAINAAAAAGGGGTVYLGQYQYCINQITISSPVRIVGAGINGQSVPTTGFRACSTNLAPMINITSNGVVLDNIGINMATPAGSFSSSGEALYVGGFRNHITHVEITDPCIGVIDAGNNNEYTYDVIAGLNYNLNASACGGIQLGTSTVQSVDALVFHTTIPMPSANSSPTSAYGWGMNIVNEGGAVIAENDILFMQTGTLIDPPNGAVVAGGGFSNTVLGDSTYGNSLTIQPGSGGTVESLYCNGCWSGSAGNWKAAGTLYGATGVWVHNDNGGTVSGVRFIDLKQEYSSTDGLTIGSNVIGVQVIGGEFCGDSSLTKGNYPAISTYGNNILISGNYIAANCFGSFPATKLNFGIIISAGGNVVIQGNWVGADNNGTKNITTGIAVSSGVGAFCEGNNYISGATNNFVNSSSSTNTCY